MKQAQLDVSVHVSKHISQLQGSGTFEAFSLNTSRETSLRANVYLLVVVVQLANLGRHLSNLPSLQSILRVEDLPKNKHETVFKRTLTHLELGTKNIHQAFWVHKWPACALDLSSFHEQHSLIMLGTFAPHTVSQIQSESNKCLLGLRPLTLDTNKCFPTTDLSRRYLTAVQHWRAWRSTT